MFIKLFTLFLLLVELLSPYDLSPINDNNNQHQLQITNTLVNQPTLSTILSTVSTNMKWIKPLKNLTENNGRTVVLECQVKSSYPVTFNWYRYNNPLDKSRFIINENSFRSSIRLRNIKESIAGFYTCEVSNGFHVLTSTGFVRVKNPDINPIDLNDDLLPSIEFQPDIIYNNEQSIDKLKCEMYKGNICRSILGSKYISITSLDQKDIEQNLMDNMKFLSNECQQFLLPMICLFVYPLCDNNRINIRSICRKSCYYFQNNSCMKGFSYSHNIPTCENLPPSSDDTSCIHIIQYRNEKKTTSSTNIPPIFERLLSFDSLSIVLISICIPITCICVSILILCCCCHDRNNNKKHLSSSSKKSPHLLSSPFHSKIHHNITSSSSSSTNTNLTNIHYRQIYFKTESKHLPSAGNSLCEIPFVDIRFLQEIGEGEFGRIYMGELIDSTTKCIIKSLENEKANQDSSREIEIFRHIRHINISCLIGICIQTENAFSLMMFEYLNNGDLHEYLVSQTTKTIDLTDLFHISIQIVSGMIYLSEKKFLHNDLSTRNIFISENMDIKITNIARYRRKYHLDYYKLASRLLPVRWMSIESLLSGIYSEMSDVWSFGVLLWEMFSYGMQPYHGQTNPEVIEMIRDAKFLICPINCPKRIYALMCSCWEEISDQRPTFIEIMRKLRQFEENPTTLLSIDDELISVNQMESPTTKYRSLMSRNERMATQSIVVDRNSIRLEA